MAQVLGFQSGTDDFVLGGRGVVPERSEEISAEQRRRRLLEHQTRVPTVWDVWGVDVPDSAAAGFEYV
ncbi:hypothetical protein QM646_44645, partial [Rhodococcus erythropolis]|nr:hypothetical protein [Rhodococcus erythropolis]